MTNECFNILKHISNIFDVFGFIKSTDIHAFSFAIENSCWLLSPIGLTVIVAFDALLETLGTKLLHTHLLCFLL